ncbi:MAG: mechanosensitive ion channel family protein [Deltaproteobacteria bacterium]|nr:mechanosensitive ion channel family protein [Deltaproteobacteria bacterium]
MSRWIILWFLLIGLMGGLRYLEFELKHFSVIERILLVSLLISFMFFIAEVVGDFIKSYVRKAEVDIPQVSIFEHFTKWLVVVLGILVILYSLGIPIGPVLTGFGIGGLAVALALQDTLSNFFSGLHLLMSKQIRPGDYVKLESGEEGYVVDITWRNTVIKELPNNYIIVPNAKISKAVIKNYYFPDTELAITISLGVGYSSDLDRVEKITIEVAKEVMREVEGGVPSFEPFVRYHTFSDSSINFNVILRAKEFVDQHLIRHEFLKRLHRRYREEGITIPYPTRMVYLRKKREDIQKNTG